VRVAEQRGTGVTRSLRQAYQSNDVEHIIFLARIISLKKNIKKPYYAAKNEQHM
jgi:hypothetical protein